MKKIYLITALLTLFVYQSFSQNITNYAFSASSGTFTALSGANGSPGITGSVDEGYWSGIDIGFDFFYMGVRYTTVAVSTNGWLTLGGPISTPLPGNNLVTASSPRPVLAPLWDNLDVQTGNNATFLTTGATGSRVFTLQILNNKWDAFSSGNTISFQVKLYEATGKIEYVYRQDATAVNAGSASIGITGTATGSGNFLSLNGTGTAPSVSSTTETNNLATKPATGQTYTFTPPIPMAPSSLTFSSVTASAMTLNWVDNSSNETGFVIYGSTDGVNYSYIAQTAANATSSLQTGLTAQVTYYWRVFAVTEGCLSTGISGTQATTCASPPSAPTVTTPVTYCQNATATQLTATGSNLIWNTGTTSGAAGGTTTFNTTTYVDGVNTNNNKKTNFTTTAANVTITTVDYYIPANQTVNGLKLAIFNSSGTAVATSSTTTTQTAGASAVTITNTFNYTITIAGDYSIGISSGTGNIGSDNPGFPITEISGTINVTGVSVATFRCFNNIQFTRTGSSTAPTPVTTLPGTTNYTVTQIVGGCVSPNATIAVVINATPTTSAAGADQTGAATCGLTTVTLAANAPSAGTGAWSIVSGSGGTVTTPTSATSTFTGIAGNSYTLRWTISNSQCTASTDDVVITFNQNPSATISYAASPYCTSAGTAAVTFSGTAGGTYSSTTGMFLNASTGLVNLYACSPGTYTVTYTVTSGACTVNATTSITISASPAISQLPLTSRIANYKCEGNAIDAFGINNGTLQNSPASATDRFGVANSAYTLNGSSSYVSTENSYSNPGNFTISIWFKTASVTGGKLIGFGKSQTGQSGQYDRHIYMNNAGKLYFGVYPNTVVTVNSALSYNDNNWHLATASLSSTTGMALYVDGALVGSNTSTTTAENYTGYWRIGYDNNSSWTSQPTSFYFNGILDDALIYHRTLTPAEVAVLYVSPGGAGGNGRVCSGSTLNLTATTVGSAVYGWTGPNGFTSAVQNPSFTYTAVNAGVYTLQVTAAGCTSTAYTTVTSSANAGQWTGAVSTDWSNAGNWCSGTVPTSVTNVTIATGAANMPNLITNVACNNLTINAGATLTTSLAGTLNIAGTLTNSGTITNSGTTNFNGTSGQQTFSGVTQFYNLTVSNAAGLLLPVAITVNNHLTIASGILNANNFNVTVKGNWINNSSVAGLTAGTAAVTFGGTSPQTIGGTFTTSFNNLTIATTSSTVILLINAAVYGNLSVNTGTLDLATFTANRASAGGNLSVSNNATLKIGGINSFPANYTTSALSVAGTVEYSGTNQTVSNQSYGNLTLSSSTGAVVKTFPGTALDVLGNLTSTIGAGSSVSFTAGSNITISGNVSIGLSTTFNGGSFEHTIRGNWVNSGTFTGSTSTITFIGPGTAVTGSGNQNFNNLTIAASLITFSTGSISLTGNLATTGTGSFSQASGGTILMTGTGTTISGSGIAPDNLTISGTVSTTASLNITGNLSVSGSLTASAGIITMSGASKSIAGAGTKSFATLYITGTVTTDANFSITSGLSVVGSLSASAGTCTFTGTSTLSGTPNLFNLTINGTSLQLSANSIVGIANVFTITAGTLNVTSSAPNTVNFNGTGAQSINAITYCNLLLSNGNTKTAAGNITTTYDINIGSGTTFNPSSYTLSIYGNWINSGIFTAGTSTAEFLGPATASITGATTFNILTSNTSSSTTVLILNNNVSATTVNMTNGIISTGANTITITGTRSGIGFIYGHIQRTHAFTTGIAYAFEGPDNTITFSSVSSVTSITVFVERASVSGFPFGGSINRLYTISVPSGTYNATLRLHYEDNELNGNTETSMGLWNYNGSLWGAIGKSGNSTTANYVEQSGITNMSNNYTLSDNSNVVQWNGSVSSDWNTAANWTVVQGSASRPPTATDIVDLGTVAFTNQPTISSTASAKNINFGSVQAVALTMASGGSLTTGDVHGNWSSNVVHSISVNNQILTISGDLLMSSGVSGQQINLNIGSGTVTVSGILSQSGGANIIFTGAGNLNLGGDYNYTSGTFTPATGSVTYNGLNNQLIGTVSYNNLLINKAAAIASISNPLNIGGNLTVVAGEINNLSNTTISGNVTINPGAILQNFSILHIGGNWLNNGSFTATSASIFFDGTGTQTISSSTFNNLNINKPVGSVAELTGNIGIKGDLNVLSGTLNTKTFDFNRNVFGGAFTLADFGTIIFGANYLPTNFASGTFANASTVIFDGISAQSLPLPISLGNLIIRNAGVKTLAAPITVNGNLTIESGASFNGGANTITLNGHWLNSGTFIPSSSTLLLTGSAKNLSGVTTFNRVTVPGSYTFLNDMTFNGLLNITTGSLHAGSTILTTMHGDLRNSGTLYTLGTTTFTGNALQTLSLINAVQTVANTVNFNGTVSPVLNSTSAPQYGFLNINNTGGVNPSVGWTVAYGLTVGSGASFNGGTATHNILGYLTNNGTITSSGVLNFIPATAANVNLGTNFSSTGTVIFGGAGAITMAGNPGSLHNVLISNTNIAGISPASGWNVANDFTVNSGSIFNAGGYTYLLGGNIINNGTINSGTSTFSLNGANHQDINNTSAFNNLTLNKTGGLATLFSNATVNGVLNFVAGKIETGSNFLIQPSLGTVVGAAQNTGWVIGNLKKNIATGATVKTFEVGDATSYTPLAVAFSNVSTSGDLTAFTTAGDHPNIGSSVIDASKSVNRFWTLTNSGIVFTNYSATCNFVAADVDGGANTATFGVGLYNGSSWVMPVTASPNATNIQATGVTNIGDLAIGPVCNAFTSISYPATPYCSNGGTASVMLTGTGGGVFSSDAGLILNAATGTVDLALSTPGSYIVNYTVAASGSCSGYFTTTNITVVTPGTWTGAVDTDWNTAGNWLCGAIPTSAINVVLNSGLGNYPVLTGTNAINDITIASGATLTVNGKLMIGGTISNTGTFDVRTGTIDMNGSVAQTIAANIFLNNSIANLVINNNVTLGGATAVTRTLTLESIGKTFSTGNMLTLKSTAAGTARVAPLPVDGAGLATSYISGTVSVERYFPARRAWRLLTSPLSNTGNIYNAWQNAGVNIAGKGTFITGPNPSAANGMDASPFNSISMKSFSSATQGYINITNTKTSLLSNSSGSADNIGYFTFIRGDRNPVNTNGYANNITTLTSTGTLQTGKQVFPASGTYDKYSIMGNPYASPVDFNNIVRTHLMKRFYAWDPLLNQVGGYVVLDDLDGDGIYSTDHPSSLQDKNIQSGQAFFVVTDTAGAASLTYYESSKSSSSTNVGFRPFGTVKSFNASLNLLATDGSTVVADEVLAEFNDNYSEGVNQQDALKFTNINETFSLLRYGTQLAIERRPVIIASDTLFFKLLKTTVRDYQFVIRMNNMAVPGLLAVLEDSYTGISTPLNMAGSTTINFTITNIAASINADRFRVVFRQAGVLPVTYTDITARQKGNDIEVHWKVEQQLNIKHYEIQKSADGRNFVKVGTQSVTGTNTSTYNWTDVNAVGGDNYYRIRNVDLDGSFAYSKVVKVNMEKGSGNITVYPNPVTAGLISLQIKNMPQGQYKIRLSNSLGQVLLVEDIVHTGGSATRDITIIKRMANGIYKLEIFNTEGKITIIKVIKQS